MATVTAAAAGFQVVILLSSSSFQAVLPSRSTLPSPTFADSTEGAQAFMQWLVPQYPKGRWNPPPTRVCVVGMEPFSNDRALVLPPLLHASRPPFRVLEPYAADFHYLGEAEAAQGPRRRTTAQALKLCAVAPVPAAAAARAGPHGGR